jgi:uncharacterized protein YfaP (DUF2135 family)
MMIAAVLGLCSGAAHAQGVATQSVNLTATVGGYCTIDGAATGTVRSATVPVANGVVTPGNLPIGGTSGSVICTSNAKIQLTSVKAGLTNSGAAADPFVNKIHYTATATYNGTTETISTATATPNTPTAGTTTTGGPQTSTPLVLAVNIAATPSGKYLANGSFDDTLIVTLSPMP